MTTSGNRTRLRTQLAIAFALVACNANAQSVEYQVTAGAGHSDNIRRVASDEESSNLASAGLQMSLDHQSSRVQADVVSDLAYVKYENDIYDSDLVGSLAGDARVAIVPERFDWSISDHFGQVLSDPFQPATPANTENINYLSTGPDLMLGLGSQTRLLIGGRYSATNYEKSDFDSDGVSGQLGIVRLLSSSSSLSLNARAQSIEYKEAALNADYDQDDAYLEYQAEGARTSLLLDAGYSRLKRDASQDDESGKLLRIDVQRRVTASSTVALTAGEEFASSGSAFAMGQDAGGISSNAAAGRQTIEPFTHRYGSLGWTFARNRTAFQFFGMWEDRSYDDEVLDQSLTTIGAQYRRQLSQAASLALSATRSSADFKQPNADYDDDTASASLSWHLSRNVSVAGTYIHTRRSSDLAASEFSENRIWLTLSYGRSDPRATRAARPVGIDAVEGGT